VQYTGSVHTSDYLERIGVPHISAATSPFDPGYDPATVASHLQQSFHLMTNSPAQLAIRPDISRPLVLLSSTGTRLMYELRHRKSAYLASFRNYSATIAYLAENHNAVVLIGAGTRGEFREEDQMCCAWIASGLIESGFVAQDEMTSQFVERWRGASQNAFLMSRSVEYLRRSSQL
jgi:2-phosphosulfolactate phosphatase